MLPFPRDSVTLSGTNPGQFFAYGCARLIDVGASCEIGALFEPKSAGDRAAVLTIRSDGGAPPKSVTLSGTGIR